MHSFTHALPAHVFVPNQGEAKRFLAALAKLADSRGHPLTVRRYMWKMDY